MARVASLDPMEKFRFRVSFALPDGTSQVRVGFHDIQMPKRTTNKIMYREGQDPDISSVSAGLSTMEDIVMSRGVIVADGTAANDFLQWAKSVHESGAGIAGYGGQSDSGGAAGSLEYRAEVTISMLDRSGDVARVWKLYNAFPVSFIPGSDLSSEEDGEKALEQLTLAYEDFQEMVASAPTDPL